MAECTTAPSIETFDRSLISDTRKLSLLLEIAERAVVADGYRISRRAEEAMLSEAYQRWKEDHRIDHVERESPQWDAMMKATHEQYRLTEIARREERNAARRLETSIARYRKSVGISA